MVRANLDKRPSEVSAMFDRVAERYDLLNDVLSLGRDRSWRRVVAAAVGAGPGQRVLDLAAGTGTSTASLAATGADCVACDFSLGMLRVGASRAAQREPGQRQPGQGEPGQREPGQREPGQREPGQREPGQRQPGPGTVSFVAGDALRLPFGDGVFDAVTISFGLRNVADPAAALAEMRRVTRPGGRLVICEFGHLRFRPLDRLYDWGLAVALPAVARTLSRNAAAYTYLAESIEAWPDGERLAGLVRAAGWSAVRWRGLTMGVVAVHVAVNPPVAGHAAGRKV
jgi:demethylmenaquinone methyltransferase/2-methoxy-6-polyprenyl-1,4-benzoquinol methylase